MMPFGSTVITDSHHECIISSHHGGLCRLSETFEANANV